MKVPQSVGGSFFVECRRSSRGRGSRCRLRPGGADGSCAAVGVWAGPYYGLNGAVDETKIRRDLDTTGAGYQAVMCKLGTVCHLRIFRPSILRSFARLLVTRRSGTCECGLSMMRGIRADLPAASLLN